MKGNISQARINQEIRNLTKQPLSYLKANPLQNDIYTWHFTIQGPQNSDFHEGLYHGQILLPFQYPFKPPDIVFTNKNGRFQTNTKICLTITQYHPQQWNSAWTVRTMLQAVISLFNQNVMGIGYEEGSSQQRKALAKKSHSFKCDKCGTLSQIIKPRQPMKEKQENKEVILQQKKQPIQKLQYASQLNLRKVKTEDKRYQNSQRSGKIEQIQKPSREQLQNKNNSKKQHEKESFKKQTTHKRQEKQDSENSTNQKGQFIKVYLPDNDPMALDMKLQKNYISWARVLKSQKWTTIQ